MLGCFAISMNTGGLTAIQILKKAEQKLSSSTVIADVSIVIKRPKWTKTMELKTWSKGMDYAMAYVKGPDKDEGTVYLKAKKDVYNYLPKVKKTVKLPSNLLSQNWMGTDMTTDDLVKLSKLCGHLRDKHTYYSLYISLSLLFPGSLMMRQHLRRR